MNALVVLVCVLVLLMSLAFYVWSAKQLQQFKSEIQSKMNNCKVNSELIALNAGSVGLGERFIKMEKQVQQLLSTIDEMESQLQSTSPYAYAIELVHRGSTADNIAELCHISQTEAELMVVMHRHTKAA